MQPPMTGASRSKLWVSNPLATFLGRMALEHVQRSEGSEFESSHDQNLMALRLEKYDKVFIVNLSVIIFCDMLGWW